MHVQLVEVRERDAYVRRSFPRTRHHRFPKGALRPGDSAVLTDSQGRELPVQIDPCDWHGDGSTAGADITFAPTLGALESRVYRLEVGGRAPEARVRNPITVSEAPDSVTVAQGAIAYTVRRAGYNLVASAVFRDRAFLRPGSAGPLLVTASGEALAPRASEITVERSGPWLGRLRVDGAYADGRPFVSRLEFVSSKSWFSACHVVEGLQPGDAVWIESRLLFDGRPACAFGSRTAASGNHTSWTVATDGAFTVDVAVASAPSSAAAVRHEVAADGTLRLRMPPDDPGATVWFHYLHGPPDDVVNTPAAAMAAGL